MIGFGDFPDPVDLDLARKRADKQRADLKSVSPRPGNDGHDSKENEGPRFVRIHPNVNVNVNVNMPFQARTVSDCDAEERDKIIECGGRRRGLSSPERGVGLGLVRAAEV